MRNGAPKGTISELFAPGSLHLCHDLNYRVYRVRNVIRTPRELLGPQAGYRVLTALDVRAKILSYGLS